jgi:hypothetical protein
MLDYADWLKRLAEATGVPDRVAVPQGVVAAIGILYAALIVGSVTQVAVRQFIGMVAVGCDGYGLPCVG